MQANEEELKPKKSTTLVWTAWYGSVGRYTTVEVWTNRQTDFCVLTKSQVEPLTQTLNVYVFAENKAFQDSKDKEREEK